MNKCSQAVFDADKGDITFLHRDLLHQSGENIRDNIRYPSRYRLVDIAAPDYSPVRFSRPLDKFDRK